LGCIPRWIKIRSNSSLHKNGDKYETFNYRPVSLLTPFSKMFEMIMQTRILKHHTKYTILSTEQYGFRIGLKTDKAI